MTCEKDPYDSIDMVAEASARLGDVGGLSLPMDRILANLKLEIELFDYTDVDDGVKIYLEVAKKLIEETQNDNPHRDPGTTGEV